MIWEELGKGKEYDQNILYENGFINYVKERGSVVISMWVIVKSFSCVTEDLSSYCVDL